ncbi:MAG: gliding motility lipoprotein GldH [Fluviicola sp.]|jgi:gliding motility-associated lipoprotein GldH
MRILVLSILLALALGACSEQPVYTKSYTFNNNEWPQQVKPVFDVEIPDTTNFYTITIMLRTTTDYGYNNLWFFLHSKTPKGQIGKEPIEIKIAHPDGSWIGEKSGTVVETKVQFAHRKFPQAGKYRFMFEQGITETVIKEVMDISYTVTKDPIAE